MKIWYDAGTGKHIRYGTALGKRLRRLGHEVILTTRKHPDTLSLARFLGEKPIVVGKYSTASKSAKLKESLKRQLLLFRMFEKNPPDLAVMHVSIECARIAFGLGIPLISTFDTPHAEAQSKLTVPLASVIIASRAIPAQLIHRYGTKRLIQFDGVDEVAWMRNFRVKMKFDFKKPVIVVRQMEIKAAYAEGISDITEKIAKKLTSFGTVVFLPRYDKRPRKGLIVPKDFVDSASLAAQADLVVSVGGTISREAALTGTPSIVIKLFDGLYVNEYLARKGFPIFIVKPEQVIWYAKRYMGRRWDVKSLMESLENPIDVIENVIKELSERSHAENCL